MSGDDALETPSAFTFAAGCVNHRRHADELTAAGHWPGGRIATDIR
jgi:hypothetical protein